MNNAHTNTTDTTHTPDCNCRTSEGPGRSLARRMRLVGKLLRHEMRTSLSSKPELTRGDLKQAAATIDERVTSAVTSEELATTIATLDKIAEAFGGRDALPLRPHGRGRAGFGRGSRGHARHERFDGWHDTEGRGRGEHHRRHHRTAR